MRLRVRLMQLKKRLYVAYIVLFKPKTHWFLVSMDGKNLIKLLDGRSFDVDIDYHKLRLYLVHRMIKQIGRGVSDTDLVLEGLEFENEAENYLKTKS